MQLMQTLICHASGFEHIIINIAPVYLPSSPGLLLTKLIPI